VRAMFQSIVTSPVTTIILGEFFLGIVTPLRLGRECHIVIPTLVLVKQRAVSLRHGQAASFIFVARMGVTIDLCTLRMERRSVFQFAETGAMFNDDGNYGSSQAQPFPKFCNSLTFACNSSTASLNLSATGNLSSAIGRIAESALS
jgi:hypothetical protein